MGVDVLGVDILGVDISAPTHFVCLRHALSFFFSFFFIFGFTSKSKTMGECGGSMVECRTPEREVGGSKPTAAVLCP